MTAVAFSWITPVSNRSEHHPGDWKDQRERIDLAQVVTGLLGPAPGRRGERSRRLWWACPFHQDKNPSFAVDPGKPFWRCFGCGEHGDAANFLMRLEGLPFPEAVRKLTGQTASASRKAPRPAAQKPSPPPPAKPSGLDRKAAEGLVDASVVMLWTSEGAETLAYLEGRGLTRETIKAARLGLCLAVSVPKGDGTGTFTAAGIVIPWFGHDGRLAVVKIRQPPGRNPKYVQAFRDPAAEVGVFPGLGAVRPGRPLVIVEGEMDALLAGQELNAWDVSVITLGSASARPGPSVLGRMLAACPWILAMDADDAGDKSAAAWPARAVRIRPPAPAKDWGDAHQLGRNMIRHTFGRRLYRPAITFADPRELQGEHDPTDPYAAAEREAIQAESATQADDPTMQTL